MLRDGDSWFLQESVVSGSFATEVSIVESESIGFEVSERVVGAEEGKADTESGMNEPLEGRNGKRGDSSDETSLSPKSNVEPEERLATGTPSQEETEVKENASLKSITLSKDGEVLNGKEVDNLSMKETNASKDGSLEENQDSSSISSGERERADQEATFKSRYSKAMEFSRKAHREEKEEEDNLVALSKSALTERPEKEDLAMTDYSQVYTSGSLCSDSDEDNCEVQKDSTPKDEELKKQDEDMSKTSNESDREFGHQCGSSMSSTCNVSDKYNVTAESTLTEHSEYDDTDVRTMSSKSSAMESAASENEDKYGLFTGLSSAEVAIQPISPVEKLLQETTEQLSKEYEVAESVPNDLLNDPSVAEKSVEDSVASATGSLDKEVSDVDPVDGQQDLSHSMDDTANGSFDDAASSGLSKDFSMESLSTSESIELSLRENQSYSLEASLDSYEGTVTSFEGTDGTFTDTSTILEESFSDDSDDPIFDILGWMTDGCGIPGAAKSLNHCDGEDRNRKAVVAGESEGRVSSKALTKKLELLTDYVKTETPLKHLALVEDCTPSRAPLSPKSTTNTNSFLGKTPKHANKSTPEVMMTDTTHEETDHTTEGNTSEKAADENAPESSPRELASQADTVDTGADTIRAGIRRLQQQNKVLSGARKKMEAAMWQRKQKLPKNHYSSPSSLPPPFPVISEDAETPNVGMGRLPRNRWKKQTFDDYYANSPKGKSSRRRHKRRHHNKSPKTETIS